MSYAVTVVCTGNICRSPIGEMLLAEAFADAGLAVDVTSAGTGGWHIGDDMDVRARAELEGRGHDVPRHSARRFDRSEFASTDLILAADRGHFRELHAMAPDDAARERIVLLRSFDPSADQDDVPDPYYGEDEAFAYTYTSVAAAVPGIVEHVRNQLS